MAKDDPTVPKPVTQYVLGADDLKSLIAGVHAAASQQLGGTTAGMPEAMTKLLAQIESLQQTAMRQVRHENPNYEEISVYTYDPHCEICKAKGLHFVDGDPLGKRGHPRPEMIYDYEFCDAIVRPEWLTVPEIELINQFTQDKSARNGTWTATISRVGTRSKLIIKVPYRGVDTRQDLPTTQAALLIELLYGETIADPHSALLLVQQLQKQVADLEERLAAKV